MNEVIVVIIEINNIVSYCEREIINLVFDNYKVDIIDDINDEYVVCRITVDLEEFEGVEQCYAYEKESKEVDSYFYRNAKEYLASRMAILVNKKIESNLTEEEIEHGFYHFKFGDFEDLAYQIACYYFKNEFQV